jgi:hypothetical protein
MKERPILFSGPMVRAILDGRKTQTRRIIKPQPGLNNRITKAGRTINITDPKVCDLCPYGKPGDRLWVQESWYESPMTGECKYKADGEIVGWRPRPSIHMPRLASRITLEVTGIRCERLQDISVDDCIAEGMDPHPKAHIGPYQEYHNLWESIHGEGSCDANPYVFVVEFKRVTP